MLLAIQREEGGIERWEWDCDGEGGHLMKVDRGCNQGHLAA